MRIIAGEKRGRLIKTLEGEETRPTLSRVKEGVFSAIQFYLPGAQVLDLYAGSGQLGLEALSRGAKSAVFIDQNKAAADLVIENAKNLGLFEACRVACMGADAYVERTTDKFDVVFLDPPYNSAAFPQILEKLPNLLKPGAIIICESVPEIEFEHNINGLTLEKSYKYGTVLVHRYRFEEV